MEKNIKIVGFIIMQTILVLISFILIILSLKYEFSIKTPMLLLLFSQLVIFKFVFDNFSGKKRKNR